MRINKFEVLMGTSEYVLGEHLCIMIDGISFDRWLDQLHPDRMLNGLIPTIVDWLHDEGEQVFVRSRYLATDAVKALPILMCPDDCDLSCSLVVAQVITEEEHVVWKRVGFDQSRSAMMNGYEAIGTTVEWFEEVPILRFNRMEYEGQLRQLFEP